MSAKVRFIGAVAVLALVGSAAFADDPKITAMTLPAKKGQITSVGNLNARLQDDCSVIGGFPQLSILRLPTHGKFEVGYVEAPASNPAQAKCSGKQGPAVGMFYSPDDGFTGEDSVEFQFVGQNPARFLLKLNVQ